MDTVLPLLLQFALIMLNAFFACAEIAVISTNDAKINKLCTEGSKRAKVLKKIKENPSNFLSTIQIAITISGFLGSAFAAENFAGRIVNALLNAQVITQDVIGTANTIVVIFLTITLSFLTIVFGELIPKRIGLNKAEKISLLVAHPLMWMSKLLNPIIWFLTLIINTILRLLKIDPDESDGDEGEENIKMMVDMSEQKGLIDKEEQEMIRNVFEFDDLSVGEFATHRTEMEFLWEEDDIETWDTTIKNSLHKYYPICREDADDIVGILNLWEYFKLNSNNKDEILMHCVQPAYFVPMSLKADLLFKQMKQTNNKFVIVLDEHGGVNGIVTMNDVLEQIVGDFRNADIEKNDVIKIEENTWMTNGLVAIEDVNKIIGSAFKSEEYDTIGGLIFDKYGSVPADKTTFEIDIENYRFSVQKIEEHQIEKLQIQKLQ